MLENTLRTTLLHRLRALFLSIHLFCTERAISLILARRAQWLHSVKWEKAATRLFNQLKITSLALALHTHTASASAIVHIN